MTTRSEPDLAATDQAVTAILSQVADEADEVDQARRLPDRLVTALRATGVNRLMIPAALGGLQAPVHDVMDVVERLAAVDGSTAWCAVIGLGSNFLSGYLPRSGAERVFADPDRPSATMFSPAGRLTGEPGRRVLDGRWPFASNCLHSEWIGLGAHVLSAPRHAGGDTGGVVDPLPRVAFVPMSAVRVEDTWDSSGLRGTGSHHVRVTGVPVPEDQLCSFADRPWPEGTVWRLPIYTALLPALTAVPLGLARGALDEIARQIHEGRDARRGQLSDDPVSLADFAAADARLRGARAGVREAVAEAQARAERGEPVAQALQARVYVACLHACDTSVEVASVAHQLGGGAAAYRGHRLLRALDDVLAARQHLLFSHKHYSEMAKALALVDVFYPPFLIPDRPVTRVPATPAGSPSPDDAGTRPE